MSERKSIVRLPAELRQQLEKKLIDEDYTSLADLSDWLDEEGYPVTTANIGRYKLKLCDGIHLTDWLDRRKPPDSMRLTLLQQELGIITAVLARLVDRDKAVKREIKKRMVNKK